MTIPKSVRDELKKPLGKLVPKDQDLDKNIIKSNIPNNTILVTVGDATTRKMIEFGIYPDIHIIDGIEKREKCNIMTWDVKTELLSSNPPGTISMQSINIIKKAFKIPKPVRIIIQGEEDLLVLPVCCEAPPNCTVLYGQPNEGLVIVDVDQVKNKATNLLNQII